MNKRYLSVSKYETPSRQLNPEISREAMQTLALGETRGWNFHLLGVAQLPLNPVHLEKWLIIPADQDHSVIPPQTFRKIQTLYVEGIKPKGFVVVHEAPRYLPSPKHQTTSKSETTSVPSSLGTGVSQSSGVNILSGLGTILIPIAMILGAIMFGLATIDPILIVVTEAGEWIEIDRWDIQA